MAYKWARVAVWALIFAYIGLFSWLSVTRYRAFGVNAYDLGNVNQAFWNTVHGRPLYFTNWRGVELNLATDSRLAMHVEPIYFLMAPIYWLWQRPETVLILQTIVLALGAWPVFWLARERLRSEVAGVAFAAVYLLFPGLEAANLWEFHAVALAAPLLLFAFYFGQANRWKLFWVFAVLAMMTKEEVPLTAALIGLYFVFWEYDHAGCGATAGENLSPLPPSPARRGGSLAPPSLRGKGDGGVGAIFRAVVRRDPLTWPGWKGRLARLRRPAARHGLILTGVALVWFVVAVMVVIPHFEGRGSPYLAYYGDLSEGTGGVAQALLSQPSALLEKFFSARNLKYLVDLYTPVGFLSLFSPLTLGFSLPDLVINLLSDHEPMHFVEKYHYVAPLLPGVMISAIQGLGWLSRQVAPLAHIALRWIALPLVAAVLGLTGYYHYYHGYTPLARAFEPYQVTAHDRLGAEIAQSIPEAAAVSAQPNLNPLVSGRKTLYRFPYIGDADTIFLDVSTLANQSQQYELIQKLLAGGEFGVVQAQDGFLVLRRGAPAAGALPDQFYTFARADSPAMPQYPANITFGDALRLIGFDLAYGRRTEMPQTPLRFVLYWQVMNPVPEDLGITLYLLGADRKVIGCTNLETRPGILTWYPTSRWQVGDTIRMEIDNMPWWTAQYARYGVALGVQHGLDVWDVAARLHPQIRSSPVSLPYTDNDTLVGLISFRTDAGGMPIPQEQPHRFTLPPGASQTAAAWEGGPELLGYSLSDRIVRPGEDLNVVLYWRTSQPIEANYKVFVHLIEDGSPLAQHDATPGLDGFPTSEWQLGEIVRDRHPLRLPSDLPEGAYTLQIGWYDPSSGQRLALAGGGDAFALPGQVSVQPR